MQLPETYEALLGDFIGLKSVSTDPAYKDACRDTAEWLQARFTEQGFTAELLEAPNSNPLVHAYHHTADGLPTVLIYGHYDVQPADADGWNRDPFTVHEQDGRLFARGIMDNKGQVLVHIASVFDAIAEGSLGYNVRFLIEGDEETGSPDLEDLLRQHKLHLASDFVLLSDTAMLPGDRPTIDASFRSTADMRVELKTAPNSLHSGACGGAVPNAAMVLTQALATLTDETGRVCVEGFYEGCALTSEQDKVAASAGITDEIAMHTLGVPTLLVREGNTFASQVALEPSLEVTGVVSGYTGAGYSGIIPNTAEVRLNIRGAPGQKTHQLLDAVAAHIKGRVPSYAEVQIDLDEQGDPFIVQTDTPHHARAAQALEQVHNMAPTHVYWGGTIPIIGMFQDILQVPVVSVGLANPDCNIHGVNENFRIDLINKGYDFSRGFLGGEL